MRWESVKERLPTKSKYYWVKTKIPACGYLFFDARKLNFYRRSTVDGKGIGAVRKEAINYWLNETQQPDFVITLRSYFARELCEKHLITAAQLREILNHLQ